jgi:hypothetical protein
MEEQFDHGACVHAWLERTTRALPPGQLPLAFERALNAVWKRAERILGDMTLTAIADRVFYTAVERFPFLASIEVSAGGVRCEALAARPEARDPLVLIPGLRFLLVEFLTVLGNLTADILTPALHSELSEKANAERLHEGKESQGESQHVESKRESSES